jgi:multimeric flavodoxin WrbA
MAKNVLSRLGSKGVETELVNFDDYRITPCQHCDYECVQRYGPKGANLPCPIDDDVRAIWEKTWAAEILLLFVPNYGGLPPALWVAFSQRSQSFFRQAPADKLKKSVVSAVVIASPANSSGAQWTPSVMADEVKWLGRKVAAFEVINNAGFGIEGSFGGLADVPEVQRRMEYLADHTLLVAETLNITMP